MPIQVLSKELILEIIATYGQVTKLNLSSNEISYVENLESLTCLAKLSLSRNRLGPVQGCLDGLARLTRLRELDLSENAITSLAPLTSAPASLEVLNVANNAVAGVEQVKHLASLTSLRELLLWGNPLSEEDRFRRRTLDLLPSLGSLDRRPRETRWGDDDEGRTSLDAPMRESHPRPDEVDAGVADISSTSIRRCTDVQDTADTSVQPRSGSLCRGDLAAAYLRHGRWDKELNQNQGVVRLANAASMDAGRLSRSPAPASQASASSTGKVRVSAVAHQSTEQPHGFAIGSFAKEDAHGVCERPAEERTDRHAVFRQVEKRAVSLGSSGSQDTESLRSSATGEYLLRAPGAISGNFGQWTMVPKNMQTSSSGNPPVFMLPPFPGMNMMRSAHAVDYGVNFNNVVQPMIPGVARLDGPLPDDTFEPYSQPISKEEPSEPASVHASTLESRGCGEVALSVSTNASIEATKGARVTTVLGRGPEDNELPVVADVSESHTRSEREQSWLHEETRPAELPGPSRDTGVTRPHGAGDARSRLPSGHAFHGAAHEKHAAFVSNSYVGPGMWNAVAGRHAALVTAPEARQYPDSTPSEGIIGEGGQWKSGGLSRSPLQPPSNEGGRGGAGPIDRSTPAAIAKAVENQRRRDVGIAREGQQAWSAAGKGVVELGLAQRQQMGKADSVMVTARDWEALRRENEDLRQQASLAEKRCAALTQMQHLADRALARNHHAVYSVRDQRADSGNKPDANKTGTKGKHAPADEEEDSGYLGAADVNGVAKLLTCWRQEVLKLLLERGVAAEVAEGEKRDAASQVREAREARRRAEADAEALTQRAIAAEAEADLSSIKLQRALDELRDDRAGRRAAEASSVGHAAAVRSLHGWVHGFVDRAGEGLFEREAFLARAVAKLEEFSKRVDLAADRLRVLATVLQHKEVQLRNGRAALVADRRVWLLERREREQAAMEEALSRKQLPPATPPNNERNPKLASALLEGLRPECEAVMRALFCRVDRLGTGAVRARRLLSVLRSDYGVSELMEAAVGPRRWSAALDAMEAELCAGDQGASTPAERDITWGEFLLFFLPSAGTADEAYNAGLASISPDAWRGVAARRGDAQARGDHDAEHVRNSPAGLGNSLPPPPPPAAGALEIDAVAMLQMVVPPDWTASRPCARRSNGAGAGRDIAEQSLAALSVGQLRGEVMRLARERAFVMTLVAQDGRRGRARAEAVHDQYRHELRILHARIREAESAVKETERRIEEETERAHGAEGDVASLREEMREAEEGFKRRLDAEAKSAADAVARASREASAAATATRDRFSKLEAEHALALRENGKASVRQRSLERELARIKSSMATEARLEKDALEERLREAESKLAVIRRERNALLAALRDIQKRGSRGPDDALGRTSVTPASPSGTEGRTHTIAALNSARGVTDGTDAGRDAARNVAEREREKARGMLTRGGGLSAASPAAESQDAASSAGRAASLTARLEVLAVQTRDLLADGSDTSFGDDDDEDSSPE